MATRDELVVWVKQLINKKPFSATDDTGDPSNAVIIASIEYARRMLYNRYAPRYPARFTASVDTTYTGNATSVVLPAAVRKRQIVSLYAFFENIGYPVALGVKNIAELPNLGGSGIPSAYVIEANNLYVRPIPASDLSLRAVYVPELVDMANGSASPDEWPADLQLIIGTHAARNILRRNNDAEAGGLDEMVKEADDLLNDTLRSMVQDDSFVRSAPPSPFELGYSGRW